MRGGVGAQKISLAPTVIHAIRSGCSVALKHDAVAENTSFRIAFYKMRFRSIGRGWMQMQGIPLGGASAVF
jgi:hypothetical protein